MDKHMFVWVIGLLVHIYIGGGGLVALTALILKCQLHCTYKTKSNEGVNFT